MPPLYHDSPNPPSDAMYRGPRGLGRSKRPTSFLLTYRSEEANNIRTNCPNSHWIELGAHGHDGIVWLVGGPGPCSAPRALALPNQSHCPLCCPALPCPTDYIYWLNSNLYINKLVFDYKRAAYRILHLLAPFFLTPSFLPPAPLSFFTNYDWLQRGAAAAAAATEKGKALRLAFACSLFLSLPCRCGEEMSEM